MGWNGQNIYKPVSIKDVQDALGVSDTDLATLCKSTAINRWSKYKPIYHAGVSPLTNAQFSDDTGGNSGYSIKYGIKRANSYAVSDLVNNGVIQNKPWEYVRPAGGENSPYRLSDFASAESQYYGYSSIALCPIAMKCSMSDGYLPIPKVANDGVALQFYFLFNSGVNSTNGRAYQPEHCIACEDLFTETEKGYYPTILLNYKSGNVIKQYCKSCDQTVSTILSSGVPVGRVEINTKTFYEVVGGNDSSAWWLEKDANHEAAEWSIVFFLSAVKRLGTSSSYDVPNGRIVRLQYEGTQVLGSPDFFLARVKRTSWVDDMVSLKFTATMKKTDSYYNVQSISVYYQTTVNRTIHVKVQFFVPATNNSGQRLGYMLNANGPTTEYWINGVKYESVLTHTIELDIQMVNRGSMTFTISNSLYHVSDPDIYFIGSYPGGEQPAWVTLEFSYGGDAISRDAVIDCHDITTTKSSTASLIGT